MAKQTGQPSQTSPEENEQPEVYFISQDKDGVLRLSRRSFLYFGTAAGGALLLKGVCPRFGEGPAPTTTQPVQAGMMPLPRVYVHAEPKIDSNIVGTLQQNDIVLLVSDHPDQGWVEVTTRDGQRGWLDRRFVDFTRAFKSASQDFSLSNPVTPTPKSTPTPRATPISSGGRVIQSKVFKAVQAQACGEAIQNGDFETGHAPWVEESSHGTNVIITDTWPDPHQGSWVAWLGGVDDAVDKITQLFHLPADVQDGQTLVFYLKVTTLETSTIHRI